MIQRVWVIQHKKPLEHTSEWHMNLGGHLVYNKGDDPKNSGLIFGTEKQATRSLSRYDARYRDNFEIVAYDMTRVVAEGDEA